MFKWLKRLLGVQPERTPATPAASQPVSRSRTSPYWDRTVNTIFQANAPSSARGYDETDERIGRTYFQRGFFPGGNRESQEEYLDWLDSWGTDIYDDFWADWREWYAEQT